MRFERELTRLKKEFGSIWDCLEGYGAFIAGGAITSLFTNSDINDFDVYFESERELVEFLHELNGGFTVVSHTDKATLLIRDTSKIQLIRFDYFKTANEIFDKFDFTVCMGAYSFKDKDFHFHDDFFKHNSQRVLQFNPKTAFPYISMMRVKKYETKGYSISKPQFARIMLACSLKPIKTYEDACEQLGGMYGADISSIIDNKDSFSVESLIDKLGKIDVSNFNFDMPNIPTIDPFELVYLISKEKIVVYSTVNGSVAIINDKIIEVTNRDEFEEYDLHDKFVVGTRLYKWVKSGKAVLRSHYETDFTYPIGEVVSDIKNGLWVSTFASIEDLMYSNYRDSVLIELEVVDGCRFLGYNSNCVRATKLKVVRVVDVDRASKTPKVDSIDVWDMM